MDFQKKQNEFHITVISRISANCGETVAQFSVNDLGIAWLPDFFVDPYIQKGQLEQLMPEYEISPVPISLVYSQNRMMPLVLKTFIEYLLAKYTSKIAR